MNARTAQILTRVIEVLNIDGMPSKTKLSNIQVILESSLNFEKSIEICGYIEDAGFHKKPNTTLVELALEIKRRLELKKIVVA